MTVVSSSSSLSLIQAVLACDMISVELALASRVSVAQAEKDVIGGLIQAALKTKKVGRMPIVTLLAQKGARVDGWNDFGVSALFEVLTATLDHERDRSRALAALLAAGADANACVLVERSEIGSQGRVESGSGPMAALCVAAQVGDVGAMEELLRAKADPNGSGSSISPMRMAVRSRQPRCVACLLLAGADPERIDGDKSRPVASIRDMESLRLLMAAGVQLDRRLGQHLGNTLQAWSEGAADDQLLRWLSSRYPSQIWEIDQLGETASSRLWRRWGQTKETWIPALIAEWQSGLLETSPVAMATGTNAIRRL
jgi:hypothetical protein